MTDRKYLPEDERLAVAAEIVEMLLDDRKSQTAIGRALQFSQPTIGKAIYGDVGPFVRDALLRVRDTTMDALKRKHSAVLAKTAEMPWERWDRAERKQGSRIDLGHPAPALDADLEGFARQHGIEPETPPTPTPSTLAKAIEHMRTDGWSNVDIDFVRSRVTLVDPGAATDWRLLAGSWEEALRAAGRRPSKSGEHAKSKPPVLIQKDRRGPR